MPVRSRASSRALGPRGTLPQLIDRGPREITRPDERPRIGSSQSSAISRAIVSGRSEFQPLEIMAHGLAIALAARHRGAAGHHQDEVTARGAADLLYVAHVDEAGAADAQHRLGLKGLLRLLQRAAGVEDVAADREAHVVAVGLHHLDL